MLYKSNFYILMKLYLYIILSLAFVSCNSPQTENVIFSNLNQEIQDTLLIINHKVLEEGYLPNSLIDFSGNCVLKITEIGPWTYSKRILNTNSMKSVKIRPNTPDPYIVYDNYLYYPDEYNLFIMGFSDTTVFKRVPFK